MLSPKQVHTQIQSRPGKDPRAESSWIGDVSPAGTLCAARAPLAPLPPLVHTAPGPPLGKRNYFRNLKHNVLNLICNNRHKQFLRPQLSHLRRLFSVGQVAPLEQKFVAPAPGPPPQAVGKNSGPHITSSEHAQQIKNSRVLKN